MATFSFTAESPGELDLAEGDQIELTRRESAEWLVGRLRGKEGTFPECFVKIVQDFPPGWDHKKSNTPSQSSSSPATVTVRVSDPGTVRVSDPGTVRVSDPGTVRVSDPGTVRVSDPGTVRVSDPGTVRVSVPGTVRVSDPGRVRVSDPGTVRVSVPGTVRVSDPGTVRLSDRGTVGILEGSQVVRYSEGV